MYKVDVEEKTGTCESPIIVKMLKNGDIAFIKLENIINEKIYVTGYMIYTGTYIDNATNTNITNKYLLVATNIGYIRTGSNIFLDTFLDYIGEVQEFYIRTVKTKLGCTYKPEPILYSYTPTLLEEKNE